MPNTFWSLGPDLADLYVTTGIHKSVVEEDAGRLFVIRGLGVKGVAANGFSARLLSSSMDSRCCG